MCVQYVTIVSINLIVNVFLFDERVLIFIFRDSPVVLGELSLSENVCEFHIVSNHDQLKVLLVASTLHDFDQRSRERV